MNIRAPLLIRESAVLASVSLSFMSFQLRIIFDKNFLIEWTFHEPISPSCGPVLALKGDGRSVKTGKAYLNTGSRYLPEKYRCLDHNR
jgi:hypothetical protein